MLIEVFEAEKSRLRWYYLIAYGLPLIIVSVSGAVFPHGYGTERYCWLRADNYIIYSFVGPVIIVILVSCTIRRPTFFIHHFLAVESNFLDYGNCDDVQACEHICIHEEQGTFTTGQHKVITKNN